MNKKLFYSLLIFFILPFYANGSTADELRQKIEEKNRVLQQLDAEIALYQNQIGETSAKAQTLQSTLNGINQTINKLSTELSRTQTNITKTDYTIQQLNLTIQDHEKSIVNRQMALKNLIKRRFEQESMGLIEQMLTYKRLSDGWSYFDQSVRLQKAININLEEINDLKDRLENDVDSRETQKKSFIEQKETLDDQKKLVEQSKKQQDTILKETKNTESEYRKQLQQRLDLKNAFEKELLQIEADLKIAIDPDSIPRARTGILGWPVDAVTVTQQFGDTEFARKNPGAYNGKGHNGIDLRASVGTPLKSAESGVVIGAGDTDTACPGASYGKWVLIKHNNGLTTLYAHLSLIKVSNNQTVARGELIGYSGNTGFTTGPHLHFTVYASQGVQVQTRKSTACGSTYTMPIADLKAYLNPLLFL
jgi:murein DD-endopeptidase MepM/ murein hydrolase activator NlpD